MVARSNNTTRFRSTEYQHEAGSVFERTRKERVAFAAQLSAAGLKYEARRVIDCGNQKHVTTEKDPKGHRFFFCGFKWCPTCWSVASSEASFCIYSAMLNALATGQRVFHLTLPLVHLKGDQLRSLRTLLDSSFRRLRRRTLWKQLVANYVRSVHVEFSGNKVWNPHFHVVIAIATGTPKATEITVPELKREFQAAWRQCARKEIAGLSDNGKRREHRRIELAEIFTGTEDTPHAKIIAGYQPRGASGKGKRNVAIGLPPARLRELVAATNHWNWRAWSAGWEPVASLCALVHAFEHTKFAPARLKARETLLAAAERIAVSPDKARVPLRSVCSGLALHLWQTGDWEVMRALDRAGGGVLRIGAAIVQPPPNKPLSGGER
ncbi:MAG: protein rep [Planctomycetota bacterium]|nr:protein rep [Planctomycetota bacterium]